MKPPRHIRPEAGRPASENPIGRARRPWRAAVRSSRASPFPVFGGRTSACSEFKALPLPPLGQKQNFANVPPLHINHFCLAVPNNCPNSVATSTGPLAEPQTTNDAPMFPEEKFRTQVLMLIWYQPVVDRSPNHTTSLEYTRENTHEKCFSILPTFGSDPGQRTTNNKPRTV
jgi:hypothetical protein